MSERRVSFRDALDGRFVSKAEASARPAETVAEVVKQVNHEQAAQAMYFFDVPDGSWDALEQTTRDRYRALERVVYQSLTKGD